MPPSIETAQSWQGRTMVDPAGDKLGTIDAIYLDDETGQPEWATVTSGLFTAKTAFVPLAQAQATGDSVQVPYDKAQVKDAPTLAADGNLSQDEEVELYRHYGLQYSEHRSDSGLPAGERDQDGDGVYSSQAVSGTVVQNSIIQHNARGVHLFSNGLTESVVRMNCIRDNNLGPPNTLTGQGIYLDIDFSNGLIEHNFTTLNSSAAMNLYISSDVTITHNKSLADGSALVIVASSFAILKGPIEVFYNLATQATGSTFFIGGANTDLHIIDNDLRNGAFSGIRFSDLTFVGPLLAPSASLEVRGNQIQRMGSSGMRAGGQSAASPALIDSTLARNNSHDNVVDGIRIEAEGNGANVITLNTLKHNGEHDCHDDTVGPLTGLTLNTWTNNEGDTQNRPGLCKHAATTP